MWESMGIYGNLWESLVCPGNSPESSSVALTSTSMDTLDYEIEDDEDILCILTNPFRQIPWILGSEISRFSMISLDFKEKFLVIDHYTILVVKINI